MLLSPLLLLSFIIFIIIFLAIKIKPLSLLVNDHLTNGLGVLDVVLSSKRSVHDIDQ